MPEAELFHLFVRPLNRAGIRYLIGGSVAAMFYGEPRLTHDVDFVVFLNFKDIQRLTQIFPDSDFYVPPTEVIAAEVARERGHFNETTRTSKAPASAASPAAGVLQIRGCPEETPGKGPASRDTGS